MQTLQVTSRKIGTSLIRFTNLDETPQNIKDSEANLYGWNIINSNAADVYVKFYNLDADDVTVGTSDVLKTIIVPSEGTVGVTVKDLPQFHADTALSVAVTTGIADNDTTGPTTDLVADFSYA